MITMGGPDAYNTPEMKVVYNAPTLLRLREAVGPVVGANYDPSDLPTGTTH